MEYTKNMIMTMIYDAIDRSNTREDLVRVDGMLDMFFLFINRNDITMNDYNQLCNARMHRFQTLCLEGAIE